MERACHTAGVFIGVQRWSGPKMEVLEGEVLVYTCARHMPQGGQGGLPYHLIMLFQGLKARKA